MPPRRGFAKPKNNQENKENRDNNNSEKADTNENSNSIRFRLNGIFAKKDAFSDNLSSYQFTESLSNLRVLKKIKK